MENEINGAELVDRAEALKVKWTGWSTKALGRPLVDENRDHDEEGGAYATILLERNEKHETHE